MTARETRRDNRVRESASPAIPDPTTANVLDVLKKIKAAIDSREGRLGNPTDGFVSFRDLVRLGLCRNKPGTPSYGSGLIVGDKAFPVDPLPYFALKMYAGSQDQTPPPKPTDLQITALGDINVLTWAEKDYFNHHYFQVWRNGTDEFSSAVLVGSPVGTVFADIPGAGAHYYWIRAVSQAGIESMLNSTSGTYAA